ncbi:hypothetical protein [Cryobacterium sp. TMT2-42-4]|uniref:hypothetical protein n=1 Tax=Cryobacterium sp. TMT2-42-4 TaxID=1259255 RepID=UPI00141AD247|nr:hypothetical protein [Cryobacterium sp. TMT2-42-4]
MIAAPTMVAGTIHARASLNTASQTRTTGTASSGCYTAAVTGAGQIGNRMPASIALAIGFGIQHAVDADQQAVRQQDGCRPRIGRAHGLQPGDDEHE